MDDGNSSVPKSLKDLTDTYRKQIDEFLEFARRKRNLHVLEIDRVFQSTVQSRMLDSTYTDDEVKQLVDGLRVSVENSLRSELQNHQQIFTLLLTQLFTACQALNATNVQVDIPQVEDVSAHQELEAYQKAKMEAPLGAASKGGRLPALSDGGHIDPRVAKELLELRDDNAKLRDKVQLLTTQYTTTAAEKSKLTQQLDSLKISSSSEKEKETELFKTQLTSTKEHLQVAENRNAKLDADVAALNSENTKLSGKIRAIEAELNSKVTETTQFQNMKRMLASKNEELKKLREKFGADGGDDDGERVLADDSDDE